MTTFVIATEAGIKIEIKETLKKDQVKKLENNFSEVKDFVEDKSNTVVITAQEKYIILGMMLQQVATPSLLSSAGTQMEKLMKDTINFLNDLPDDKKALDEENKENASQDDTEKAANEAFKSITEAIPGAGVFMTIFDPKSGSIHMAGNLDKSFVLSTLLMNG